MMIRVAVEKIELGSGRGEIMKHEHVWFQSNPKLAIIDCSMVNLCHVGAPVEYIPIECAVKGCNAYGVELE